MNMSREEEDDDLESLRLAALKSRAHKDKRDLINCPSNNGGYAIKVLEGPTISRSNLPSTVRNIKSLDTFTTNRRLEQLDLNEPYVPQSVCRNDNSSWDAAIEFVSYVPSRPLSNVQLSPRSLAFVAQNNDILMRRKVEKSPINYRSPSPYREIQSRWSVSPPIIGNSPGWRSPNFRNTRRSLSRTPSPKRFIKSPKRLVSRSPNRIHRPSPGRSTIRMPVNRRSQSRSPLTKRMISRSPINYSRRNSPNVRVPYQNKRRSFSPTQKLHNSRKRLSPPLLKGNQKGSHQEHNSPSKQQTRFSRSPSPLNSHKIHERKSPSPNQFHRNQRKRSRSPFVQQDKTNNQNLPLLKRSRSRSPNKRQRRSRDKQISGRRTSPIQRNHNNKNDYRKNNRNNNSKNNTNTNNKVNQSIRNTQRTNYRNRSSHSPKLNNNNKMSNNISSSSSSQSQQIKEKENIKGSNQIDDFIKTNTNSDEQNKINFNQKSNTATTTTSTASTTKINRVKTEQELEDELLASSDDEKNSGEDNDEDEIDLFASEESESENEGRFKSSSNKNDKSKTSTVSFSKLVGTSSTSIGELKDVGGSSSSKNERSGRDYNSRRNDRDSNRKYNRSSRNDNNWKDRNISSSSSSVSSRNSDNKKKILEKNIATATTTTATATNSMKMFKPTFQAVEEIDTKSKILLADNPVKIEEKHSVKVDEITTTEKRNILQLKRPIKEPKDVIEISLPDSTTTITTTSSLITEPSSSSSSTTTSSASSSVKKPIHLRLGAITGPSRNQQGKTTGSTSGSSNSGGSTTTGPTWKNKKSWRIEKV